MTATTIRPHKIAIVAVSVYALLLLLVYQSTVVSVVSIWWRSDTFAHGFLIIPISLWLVWDKRAQLANLSPAPELRALLFLLGSGFTWMIATVANVLVIEQYAFVAMLISGTWVILGNRFTWALLFPLGFLFFGVPAGDALVPPMMELTATYTVKLLRLTGIPVYREGLFFSLPTGNWSVIEACSGVRYLIASVTLGCLFAYLSYTSWYKRCIFVVAALIVPIVGNVLRAYMIVILGHLSDMTVATGVDHLIYGWFFFGVLMLILFSVGSIWRDPPDQVSDNASAAVQGSPRSVAIATALVTVFASGWFFFVQNLEQDIKAPGQLELPSNQAGWLRQEEPGWSWRPKKGRGAATEDHAFYRQQAHTVASYVGVYLGQNQDSELVNSNNSLVSRKSLDWRIIGTETVDVDMAGETVDVQQFKLKGADKNLLVWFWYRIGDKYTSTPYVAKIFEVVNYIGLGRQDGAQLLVATEFEGDESSASAVLQRYINDSLPGVERSIDALVGEAQ